MIAPNRKKDNKRKAPTELLYLKRVYHINSKKVNYHKFGYLITFMNTFIISTIYIILMYLLKSWIARIIVGIILLILMIIICYGIIGRYYLKKEGK